MDSIASGKIEMVKSFETKEQHEKRFPVSILNAGKHDLEAENRLVSIRKNYKEDVPKVVAREWCDYSLNISLESALNIMNRSRVMNDRSYP
jgi:hypothetical protein